MFEIPDISNALRVKSCGSQRQRDGLLEQGQESCSAHQGCSQLPLAGSLKLKERHPEEFPYRATEHC